MVLVASSVATPKLAVIKLTCIQAIVAHQTSHCNGLKIHSPSTAALQLDQTLDRATLIDVNLLDQL